MSKRPRVLVLSGMAVLETKIITGKGEGGTLYFLRALHTSIWEVGASRSRVQGRSWLLFKSEHTSGEESQQVKVLSSRPGELSSVPVTHAVEGENRPLEDVLSLHTCTVACGPLHK